MSGMTSLPRAALAIALALIIAALAPGRSALHSAFAGVAVANAPVCLESNADRSDLPVGRHHEHDCASCLPGFAAAIAGTLSIASIVMPLVAHLVWKGDNASPPRGRRAYARFATGPPSIS